MLLNDSQSRLNEVEVAKVVAPGSVAEIGDAVRAAAREGLCVSVSGGRHAMGGQQFAAGSVHVDTSELGGVIDLDRERGLVTVGCGARWPALIEALDAMQDEGGGGAGGGGAGGVGMEGGGMSGGGWAIRQKQTGVDEVSIAGSLGANIHGRGLRMRPFVEDVESFALVGADGEARVCSRDKNRELFGLAIGGYGLFGIVATVTLRLRRRRWLRRVVEAIPVREVAERVAGRIADGFVYGDCQFAIDLAGEPSEHPGILSCYEPVETGGAVPEPAEVLPPESWAELFELARRDKRAAFEAYKAYYLGSSGRVYDPDRSQLSSAFAGYEAAMDISRGTPMITEVYVTAEALLPFLASCRADFVEHGVDLMYGTIRFIEPESETFMPWARERSVCIVCNLNVAHTEAGIAKAKSDFRRIIDRAIEHGGRYYLTYHRWARRDQVLACYPMMPDFLAAKRAYDPGGVFQSEWYRHHVALLAGA